MFDTWTSKTCSAYAFVALCDPAGVMYWGDGGLDKIEKANLDGTGRIILLHETGHRRYFGFAYHAGNIYFTDYASRYDYRKTSDRSSCFLSVQVALTPGLGLYPGIDPLFMRDPDSIKSCQNRYFFAIDALS